MGWTDLYESPAIKRIIALSKSPAFLAASRMQASMPYYHAVERMRALMPYNPTIEKIIEQQRKIDRILPPYFRHKIYYTEIEQQKIRDEVKAIANKPGRPRKEKPKHIMQVIEPGYIDLFQLVLRKAELVNQYGQTIKTQNKYRLWAFVRAAIDESFFIDKSATVVGDLLQEYLGFTVTKLKEDVGFNNDHDKYREIIKICISDK